MFFLKPKKRESQRRAKGENKKRRKEKGKGKEERERREEGFLYFHAVLIICSDQGVFMV